MNGAIDFTAELNIILAAIMLIWMSIAVTSSAFLLLIVPFLTEKLNVNLFKLPRFARRILSIILFPIIFVPITTLQILDHICKGLHVSWETSIDLFKDLWKK